MLLKYILGTIYYAASVDLVHMQLIFTKASVHFSFLLGLFYKLLWSQDPVDVSENLIQGSKGYCTPKNRHFKLKAQMVR